MLKRVNVYSFCKKVSFIMINNDSRYENYLKALFHNFTKFDEN